MKAFFFNIGNPLKNFWLSSSLKNPNKTVLQKSAISFENLVL